MTKKDYVRIAAALLDVAPNANLRKVPGSWRMTCERMADTLAKDNPKFDRARFLKACGVEG